MIRFLKTCRFTMQGFSLVEVLASITIIGIIVFLAIPNIVRMKSDGEENLARARAETLNMAMASFVQALGPTEAKNRWTAATTDNARYTNIAPYIAYAPDSLDAFMPSGYDATLPTTVYPLTNRARITGPSGNINY